MNFEQKLLVAAAAAGLASAGCKSSPTKLAVEDTPSRYELSTVTHTAAAPAQIVNGNYQRATGKEAPELWASEAVIADLTTRFIETVTKSIVVLNDVLPLRDALLRAAVAVTTTPTVRGTVQAQNHLILKTLNDEVAAVTQGAQRNKILETFGRYAALTSDVNLTANETADRIMLGIDAKTYQLDFNQGALKNVPFEPSSPVSGADISLAGRIVTTGTYAGEVITPTADQIKYTLGTDKMSEKFRSALTNNNIKVVNNNIKVVHGDHIFFFAGKFVGFKTEFGADNLDGKDAQFVSVNGQAYVLNSNVECETVYAVNMELAKEEALKGNFKRAYALRAAMRQDQSVAPSKVDLFTTAVVRNYLATPQGKAIYAAIGATARDEKTGQRLGAGLFDKHLDKEPTIYVATAFAAGALTPNQALELVHEVDKTHEFTQAGESVYVRNVRDANDLDRRATELGDGNILFEKGVVYSGKTNEVLRSFEDTSTTLTGEYTAGLKGKTLFAIPYVRSR